jgi:GAF domain-containing protein
MTPDQSIQDEPVSAEQAIARLESVQRVTESALAYLNLDDLLSELLERVTEILRVDTAAVLLVEDDGRTPPRGPRRARGGGRARVPAADRARIRRRVAAPGSRRDPGPGAQPGRGNQSSLAGARDPLTARSPLVVEGQLIGVLHVGSLTPREFRDSDGVASAGRDRVGLAIERSRLAVQGRVAQALQRSLLPESCPGCPA